MFAIVRGSSVKEFFLPPRLWEFVRHYCGAQRECARKSCSTLSTRFEIASFWHVLNRSLSWHRFHLPLWFIFIYLLLVSLNITMRKRDLVLWTSQWKIRIQFTTSNSAINFHSTFPKPGIKSNLFNSNWIWLQNVHGRCNETAEHIIVQDKTWKSKWQIERKYIWKMQNSSQKEATCWKHVEFQENSKPFHRFFEC